MLHEPIECSQDLYGEPANSAFNALVSLFLHWAMKLSIAATDGGDAVFAA